MFISPMCMFWVGFGVGYAVAVFAILFILAIIISKNK